MATRPSSRVPPRNNDFEPFGGRMAEIAGASEAGESYLGDIAAVDAIVRGYLGDMLKLRKRAQAGEIDWSRLEREVTERAVATGRIFLGGGNDPDIRPVGPDWNSPTGGIIAAVRQAYDLQRDDPGIIWRSRSWQCWRR